MKLLLYKILTFLCDDDNDTANGVYLDSTYIKQRYTLYSAQTLIDMESNLIDKNDDFVFFNKLNFYRGNAQLRMYSKDLSNPTHIKHEILRSMNII
jgi:hypothetical protein